MTAANYRKTDECTAAPSISLLHCALCALKKTDTSRILQFIALYLLADECSAALSILLHRCALCTVSKSGLKWTIKDQKRVVLYQKCFFADFFCGYTLYGYLAIWLYGYSAIGLYGHMTIGFYD